jgi:hypothetical protein
MRGTLDGITVAAWLAAGLFVLPALACAGGIEEVSGDTWMIRPTLEMPSYLLQIQPKGESSDRVEYTPNVQARLGLGVYRGRWGLSGSFPVPEDSGSREEKGRTSYFDYRGSFAVERMHLVVNYQQYEGLYIRNSSDVDPAHRSGDPYIQRDDLVVRNCSANVTVPFSPDRFSLRAAYGHTARQTRSGGSLLYSFSYSDTLIDCDTSLVPASLAPEYGDDAGLTGGKFRTLSAGIGYGYTFARGSWFLTPRGTIGIGFQYRSFDIGDEDVEEYGVAAKLDLSLAGGYNGERWVIGMDGVFDMTGYPAESIDIHSQLYSVRLFTAFRF